MSAATPQNGTTDCCCHSPNRRCPLKHPGKHEHFCMPADGEPDSDHCPGGACPGRCWETTTTDTTPDPTERRG